MILPETIHILQPAACGLGSLGDANQRTDTVDQRADTVDQRADIAACQPGAAARPENARALQAAARPAASVDDSPWFRADTCAEVLALHERGIDSRAIFTEVCGWTEKEVLAVLGKCRIFTGSWDDLLVIDSAAKLYHKRGYLEMTGLIITPEAYGGTDNCDADAASNDCAKSGAAANSAAAAQSGTASLGAEPAFPETMLAELSPKLKKLAGISINGCVICAPCRQFTPEQAADYFQNCYQTAKRMTTTLPCTLSYIYMPGSLPMLQKLSGAAYDKAFTAASTFAMQNETAFFARLSAD